MAKIWYGGNRGVWGSEGKFELRLTGRGLRESSVTKFVFRAQVFCVELVNRQRNLFFKVQNVPIAIPMHNVLV